MNPGDLIRAEFSETAYMNGEYIVVDSSTANVYLVALGVPWESAMIHCVAQHEYDVVNVRQDDELILETVVGLQRLAQTPPAQRDQELGEDRYDRAAYVANVLLDVLDRKHAAEDGADEDAGDDSGNTPDVFRDVHEFFDYLDKLVPRVSGDLNRTMRKLGFTV